MTFVTLDAHATKVSARGIRVKVDHELFFARSTVLRLKRKRARISRKQWRGAGVGAEQKHRMKWLKE